MMSQLVTRTGVTALAGLAVLAVTAHPARAAISATGIEIDGNYVDDAATAGEDWYPGFPPFQDPIGSADGTLCGTNPPPKDDIFQYFVANNRDYLYLGLERLTNNGNTSFFFTFDITGDGPSFGDFMFVFCFGSGSVVTDDYVLEWDPATMSWVQDATPPSILFAVNTGVVNEPFGTLDERGRPDTTIDAGRFAEARITLADIEGFDICSAGAVTAMLESRASCSLSSQCKDTTGPFTFSFESLQIQLALEQSPDCQPGIHATANATSAAGPLTYQWFLDGVDITSQDPTWATSDSIVIPLTSECGSTQVRVVVNDGECTAEDVADVDVNRRPTAGFTALAVDPCSATLTFDGRSSSDCNGSAQTYRWDFNSDGIIDSTAAFGTYTYADCGDHLVTLVVADGTCDSAPIFQQVYANQAPGAGLSVTPGPCLGLSWSSTSTDCDLASHSSTYSEHLTQSIDFGDGSPPSTDPSGTHDYAACGIYMVTLTVTDASGCTSTATHRVTYTGVVTVR